MRRCWRRGGSLAEQIVSVKLSLSYFHGNLLYTDRLLKNPPFHWQWERALCSSWGAEASYIHSLSLSLPRSSLYPSAAALCVKEACSTRSSRKGVSMETGWSAERRVGGGRLSWAREARPGQWWGGSKHFFCTLGKLCDCPKDCISRLLSTSVLYISCVIAPKNISGLLSTSVLYWHCLIAPTKIALI